MGWWHFQKLVTGQSQSTSRRILPLVYKPIPGHPSQPLQSLIPPAGVNNSRPLSPFLTPSSESQTTAFPIPSSNQPRTENCWSLNHSPPSHPYLPSFCFGPFFLNPICLNGVNKTDEDGCSSEDLRTPTVWADSVKKKRKRKMNKHKLRKLRKRLRKKT